MHKNIKLADIRRIRKSLGMTQQKLSEVSGISQPLIARIETGKTDPSFSKAEKIFSALESSKKSSGAFHAMDIMSKKIIFISPSETVSHAARIMKRRGISQLPVLENGKVIGLISEKDIASSIGNDPNRMSVNDVMSEAPPTIGPDADVGMLTAMLEYSSCLLVASKGHTEGIITRADILKTFS
ncbi:MAG: CBS domain-containing protein [Candidatus Aenigmarchaeota archaeon]|nr:CBS domain-containing protein [Candidatus Aenigmarchaeota archaeon]